MDKELQLKNIIIINTGDCPSRNDSHSQIRTFSAETESVQVRAGDLVAAGTRGRAVDPVETGWTADGTVVALETEKRFFSF